MEKIFNRVIDNDDHIYNLSKYYEPNYLINKVQPEIWSCIPEYLGVSPIYRISNYGNIISIDGSNIRTYINNDGYVVAFLLSIDNQYHNYKIHRLVLSTFCPVQNMESLEVNHRNGIRHLNYIGNLEWCTRTENIQHSFIFGSNSNKGELNGRSIFNEDIVIKICELISKGYNNLQIVKELGLDENRATLHRISNIRNKITWTEISCNYDFPKPIEYSHAGEGSKIAKITVDEVNAICKYLEQGKSVNRIIQLLNWDNTKTNKNRIRSIKYKLAWVSISKNYSF